MASKKALPEISVDKVRSSALVLNAKESLRLRAEIASLEDQLAAAKKNMADLAEVIRHKEETEKDKYIGLVRIIDPDQSPVQVQFKIQGGALALSDGDTLDHYFKSSRPMLFEKDLVVNGITDPDALIKEFRDRGANPWDVLELKVKKDLDRAVASSPHVVKEEAYLPKEGFLATCNEVMHTWEEGAKAYMAKYLVQVLNPVVDLGKKGKSAQ
jgi:hypothetical protein